MIFEAGISIADREKRFVLLRLFFYALLHLLPLLVATFLNFFCVSIFKRHLNKVTANNTILRAYN